MPKSKEEMVDKAKVIAQEKTVRGKDTIDLKVVPLRPIGNERMN